uniref:Transcription initiation factor IIF subunit alpha n=1 Tax=Chelydra serpentina TaxID=8475 RepID=A0A8C3TBJ7_CHESE
MTSLGTSSQSVTEYVVRVPKNTPKKYNIMAFNAADKVNFTTWHQAKMERDLSNKKIYQEEEMPESGAGSEFNRKLREEARRKKYGIVLREFKPEDQPWILKVNGKAGRKFKGVKKGGVTENASYYIFTQCPDGAFEAFPVSNWYNFTPVAKHRTLTAEEAEEEWERRNKVLNHFTIMQQRRLKDQDDEEEEKEKKSKKKRSSELKIHDLEDDLEMSSDESEMSDADGEKAAKPQKKTPLTKKKKKKKKGSDDEAFEDSDDGDFEGQEVDYMSDGSSSSQEEAAVGKPKVTKEEDGPKGTWPIWGPSQTSAGPFGALATGWTFSIEAAFGWGIGCPTASHKKHPFSMQKSGCFNRKQVWAVLPQCLAGHRASGPYFPPPILGSALLLNCFGGGLLAGPGSPCAPVGGAAG